MKSFYNISKALIFAVLLMAAALSCNRHDENITVIVSLDAFRWDYPDIFDTPNLDEIAAEGVKATMKPSFPASTFPNHYTMATGLVPDHNGIVGGAFWDIETGTFYSMGDASVRYNPVYYNGEPIWNTAQRQGVRAASLYWVGSDVLINGSRPEISNRWDDTPRFSYEGRVDEALRILNLPEAERPRLLMVYFDDPDLTTHEFGPESLEAGVMVHYLDSLMGVLHNGIKALPYGDKVNLIVTADHGMTEVCPENFIRISDYVKDEWAEHIVSGCPTNIYSKPEYRDSIINALSGVEHIKVCDEAPELNYGTSPHCGDIIVIPDLGWAIGYRPYSIPGAHGFSPEEPDMQVAFRACGPDFRKGFVYDTKFINIDLYPMLCHLLGVKPAPVDGRLSRVKPMLEN